MSVFDDKVCVVTGGASGIGRATATHFARQGASVVLADLVDASDLAAEIGGTYIRTDTSDAANVENLMTQAVALHGHIDVLVNNAGITDEAEIDRIEEAAFRRQMDVNAYGVLLGIKYATRAMHSGSAIVNTSSMAAKLGANGYGSYAASKAAVISLTQVAAIEYGPRGIRVNCICPSSVETPMLQAQENGDIERELTRLASPLGVTITSEQVADVIAFLASPASSAVSGQAVNVDGGMSAGFSNQLIEASLSGLRG
jgi:3alpha(or 20beta)-hydroxysteroid dehydrogenase